MAVGRPAADGFQRCQAEISRVFVTFSLGFREGLENALGCPTPLHNRMTRTNA